MHELAIAQSIVDVIEQQAARCNAQRVKCVLLKIGEASGIVTDPLTFCFEMLSSLNPQLAGAQLRIDVVPHRAHCRTCASDFPVLNFVPQCPLCGEWSRAIVSGTELQVAAMEFEASTSQEHDYA